MSTIKDVAAFAGVSIGTVSNYFTGARYVQQDKVKLINEAVEALDYRQTRMQKTYGHTKVRKSVLFCRTSMINTILSSLPESKGS